MILLTSNAQFAFKKCHSTSMCTALVKEVVSYYNGRNTNVYACLLDATKAFDCVRYRPLSRRLDRCDRVIHNESGDPNGGNMCSFSGAMCTSRVRHNADYVPYAKIRFDL